MSPLLAFWNKRHPIVYACACALSDAMAGTGPGQLSASQVAQLSSAVVTAVSQAFSSVNGAQGQAEQSECSFSVGRPDATSSLTGTSSNTRYFCPDIVITSVKSIKNEVGCRDDTVPKTVETRRNCEED